MYDSLLEEDAWVQGYGDKREAKGKVEGEAKISRWWYGHAFLIWKS